MIFLNHSILTIDNSVGLDLILNLLQLVHVILDCFLVSLEIKKIDEAIESENTNVNGIVYKKIEIELNHSLIHRRISTNQFAQ